MKFEMVTSCLFDNGDLAIHVVQSRTRFDCELDARIAAARLNKVDSKRGCISAVACIIE